MEHRSHSWGLSYENTFKSPEVVCTLGRHSLYPRMAVCLARGIGLDETTNYTENDFLHYHTLTGKDIENAPRVTDDYYFEAHPGAAPLRTYLETLGYTKETRRLGDKEIWSKPDQVKGDIFYLYFNAAMGEVELTKVMNY